MALNGANYRSMINNQLIQNERGVAFEPSDVRITILHNIEAYNEWLKMKGQTVNFKLTNTDIDLTLKLTNVEY